MNKLIAGEKLGTPKQEHYYPKGHARQRFPREERSRESSRHAGQKAQGRTLRYGAEISVYEKVTPAAPLKDLASAKIALCTTGGIVPMGNPDHMFAATAKFWKKYDLAGLDELPAGQFESVSQPAMTRFMPMRIRTESLRIIP